MSRKTLLTTCAKAAKHHTAANRKTADIPPFFYLQPLFTGLSNYAYGMFRRRWLENFPD
jgi:hypothetical protein